MTNCRVDVCATGSAKSEKSSANVKVPVVVRLDQGLPLAVRWLDAATVYALELVLIASVYIGFAVADGRPRVVATECAIAAVFVVVAAPVQTQSEAVKPAGPDSSRS
jgi:hypothetical protein